MEIRVLGPVQVCADGRELDVGPRQQRHVLAVLAADAGRAMTTETLIDRVWDEAPTGARRALHAHITRIRRLLERIGPNDAGPVRVLRRSGGYLLDIDRDRVDAHRLRRLATEARDGRHDDDQRAAVLREAVALWRGDPLAGLGGHWAARTREGWRQQYLDTVIAWTHAELRIGNAGAAVGPLSDLTGEYPLVESLTAALMRALYAAGRPAEALEHYTTIRQRLVDELGVEPGPELRAVHQAILRGDLDSPPPPGSRRLPPPGQPVPAQLPADVSGFAGRTGCLARLDGLLAGTAERSSTAVVIFAVSGTAGVGKTALALHWAHSVADQFPDGQLYVNLRGFDPGGRVMAPAEAVRGFLDAFGVPVERIPATPDAQTGLYRSLLAGKRILIVLDNARDAEQIHPLLPGAPTTLVVVTSRNQLTSLLATDGACPLILNLLSPGEARELLNHRLGEDRVAAEPDAVEKIIVACAGLPLALTIAAARAELTGFPLGSVAAELSEARGRLDTLTTGGSASDVRAAFSWSYTALTPAAARLFRLLGLHPGPDISTAAAGSLAGLSTNEARRLLAELTRANLLNEHVFGRYTFHDLLRVYATDLTHIHDPDHVQRAATTRLLDHYTHTAHSADLLLNPLRDPIARPLARAPASPDPPTAGAGSEHPADDRAAMAWLTVEYPVLIAVLHHAADTGSDTHTWQLAWALDTFLYRRGHWRDLLNVWKSALPAARRLGDRAAEAQAHPALARAATLLGRYADAHAHYQDALDLHLRADDRAGQAHTHHNLAFLLARQGHPEQALDHAQRALSLCEATGHRRSRALALNGVGWHYIQLGEHTRAITHCQLAVTLLEQLGDREGQAAAWDSLGYAHHHAGHHVEAADCYRRALEVFRDLGSRYNEADTLVHLGDLRQAVGEPAAASSAWSRAVDILTELGHPEADTVRTKLHRLDRHPIR